MKSLSFVVCAVAALALGACSKTDTSTVTVSANVPAASSAPASPSASSESAHLVKAPAWHLKDLNGQEVSSDRFKGKVVVVDFWATWCGPCREEIPGYVDLQKKYGGEGLVIVGVAVNEPDVATVQKFVSQYGVDYQIVMADDSVVAAFGGMDAIPTTFLIDRDGNIRDHKVGTVETAEYEKRILSVLKPGSASL